MRAHMNKCVDALTPEPKIERDVGMAWRTRKIVIVRIAMIDVAAFGLDRDDDFAAPDRGKTKFAAAATAIILRRAPGVCEIILQLARKPRQLPSIIAEVPRQFLSQENLAKPFRRFDVETARIKIGQQSFDRSECIQTDRVRDLVATTGIVREHDRKLLVVRRPERKLMPGFHAPSDRADSLVVGFVRKMRELQIGIALAR